MDGAETTEHSKDITIITDDVHEGQVASELMNDERDLVIDHSADTQTMKSFAE